MAEINYNNMGNSSVVKLNDDNLDPDAKIQMSLDEIIHVYGPSVSQRSIGRNLLKRRPLHGVHQSRPFFKRAPGVRLTSTLGGGHYYVSKKSPLIKRNIARRRELEALARAEINRALNAPLLKKNQEIIPAKYKLVKTSYGLERVLVPTNNDTPPPLVRIALPRKPFQNVNKNFPPALIDTAEKRELIAKRRSKAPSILPPPLLDTAIKPELTHLVQTRPARPSRPLVNPPPLIDTSLKPDVISRTKTITSRLGPLSLIDTAQTYEPMEVEDVGNYPGPPPLIDAVHYAAKNRQNAKVKACSVRVPPLIDTNYNKTIPPPLVDLVSDDEDDVKPLLVNKKHSGRKNLTLSLSDRFTFIQN